MPTPLEIIETEMDDQVGLYDKDINYRGTGAVYNTSLLGCKESYFCGFSKVHKLPSDYNKEGKLASKIEWQLSAEAIIEALSEYEYCFKVAYINYNGFSLEEA